MGNDQQTEIDIIELTIKFYKFILKKKWLLIVSFAMGLIVGAINIKLNPYKYKNYYQKSYISFSPAVSKETLADILKGLEENIPINYNERDLTHLSSLLNLQEYIVKYLKAITIIPNNIDAKENGAVKFKIETFDKKKIDSIANHIIYYINSNPYVKARYELFLSQNITSLTLINKKFHELDSCSAIKNKQQVNTSIIINKETAELSYVELFEKRLVIEKNLKLFHTNSLVYLETNSPINTNKRSSIIIPTIIGYGFLGAIFGIFIAVISKSKKHFNANNRH